MPAPLTDDTDGLMPYWAVALLTGESETTVKRITIEALAKLRVELEKRGITHDQALSYFRENLRSSNGDDPRYVRAVLHDLRAAAAKPSVD